MHFDYAEVFNNPASWEVLDSPASPEDDEQAQERARKRHERRMQRIVERFERRGGFAVSYELSKRLQSE